MRLAYLGRAVDGDLRGATAVVSLSGNDLVVVVSKRHASTRPGVEDLAHVDRAGLSVVIPA